MAKKPITSKDAADKVVENIRRKTRQTHSTEEMIRIVLVICVVRKASRCCTAVKGSRRAYNYSWSKDDLLEAGKRRLSDTTRQATSPEVKDLRSESMALNECLAALTLENRLLKKHVRKWGIRGMRYPASEKLKIIRTAENSHLPVKQTLDMLCIPRSKFYQWYDLYADGGLDALTDHSPRPGSVWNRIPDTCRDYLIEFALGMRR